jgi:hypothetical protein
VTRQERLEQLMGWCSQRIGELLHGGDAEGSAALAAEVSLDQWRRQAASTLWMVIERVEDG